VHGLDDDHDRRDLPQGASHGLQPAVEKGGQALHPRTEVARQPVKKLAIVTQKVALSRPFYGSKLPFLKVAAKDLCGWLPHSNA
jgi:hypothetical protein